ncbi:MAG: hypothetical protein ACYCSS_04515 [Sulfuriferula sp.]
MSHFFIYAMVLMTVFVSGEARAVPAFARQTGQNCLACHAGGQFPELTPYGRLFKLTGYTIGKRTIPLDVTGVFGSTNVKGPAATGPGHTGSDGSLTFDTGSLFVAGKITDKSGVLAQFTYNNYSGGMGSGMMMGASGGASGHVGSDMMDFRYADRIINNYQDLIYGFTANNDPGVEDVWNSTPTWGYGVVPISTGTARAINPLINGALAQQVVGTGAYLYWNQTVYAEISGYRTGDGVFSFMTQGNGQQIALKGENPYLRLALAHEWGAQNVMVGYSYFDVERYSDPTNLSSATDHYRDNTVDFQYQYLLDPHTFTAEVTRINETVDYGTAGSLPDTVNALRAKASYTYEAEYGASLSYFNVSNSSNNAGLIHSGVINQSTQMLSQTGVEGWTPEIYWLPVQNMRVGLQYTMFDKVDGVNTGAIDTFNGKASGANQVVFYVWGAY